MTTIPTIVTVPCFSGAPWELDQLTPLADHDLTTMRLPDHLDDIEAYADVVADRVAGLDDYVLVGDSFGAVVALAFATRRPAGLRALVLSGGFAADPVTDPITRAKLRLSRYLPGPLYRQMVLRFHAASLASPTTSTARSPGPRRTVAGCSSTTPPTPLTSTAPVRRSRPTTATGSQTSTCPP